MVCIKQTSPPVSAHWADGRPNPNPRTYTETAPVSTPHLGRRVNVDTLSGGTGLYLEPLGVATGKRRVSEPESASLGVTLPQVPAAGWARHHTAAGWARTVGYSLPRRHRQRACVNEGGKRRPLPDC